MINIGDGKIKVTGHKGTWYCIDKTEVEDRKVFLLEHEKFGEDADHVIVDEYGYLVMEDVTNGLDELDTLNECNVCQGFSYIVMHRFHNDTGHTPERHTCRVCNPIQHPGGL